MTDIEASIDRKKKLWTEEEFTVLYGLHTFVRMRGDGIARFMRKYADRTIGDRSFNRKITQAKSHFQGRFPDRGAFDKTLRAFTAKKVGGKGVTLAEIEREFPERMSGQEFWLQEENELFAAVYALSNLTLQQTLNVINDAYPPGLHKATDDSLTKRFQRYEETTKDKGRDWLERRLGVTLGDLKLMYGFQQKEHKRPWKPEERTVIRGFEQHLGLSIMALARFIKIELKRDTLKGDRVVSHLVYNLREKYGRRVPRREFERALAKVTPLSTDEIRRQYANYDPFSSEMTKALTDGTLESILNPRDFRIVTDYYVRKISIEDLAVRTGLTGYGVSSVILRAREGLRKKIDDQTKVVIPVSGVLRGNGATNGHESVEIQSGYFDDYVSLTRQKQTAALWNKMIDTLLEKQNVVLPITTKVRYGSMTQNRANTQRLFDVAEIAVDVFGDTRSESEQVTEMKNAARGLSFLLSREHVAKKIYEQITSKEIDVEGVSIIIRVRGDDDMKVYRQTYVHHRALGRPLIVSTGK